MSNRATVRSLAALTALFVSAFPVAARAQTTSPMEEFGHSIGDDYFLVNYSQLATYWEKLAGESPRMVLDTIGRSAEDRPQLMAILNHERDLCAAALLVPHVVTDRDEHIIEFRNKSEPLPVVKVDELRHIGVSLGPPDAEETVVDRLVRQSGSQTQEPLTFVATQRP